MASAQEPALINGSHSIRYQQSPGSFHYVIPCNLPGEASPSPGTANQLPSLCWLIRAARIQIVDGKPVASAPLEGTLSISASLLRFRPSESADASQAQKISLSGAIVQHNRGKNFGVFGAKELIYQFMLVSVCPECKTGPPPQNPDSAQLDKEFDDIVNAVRDFPSTYRRLNDLAALLRVEVGPATQPTLKDPIVAMDLYAKLNRTMSDVCPAEARSCLLSYEKYQTCESATSPQDCGAAPACTAVCSLTLDQIRKVNATICISRSKDSAVFMPDWSGAIRTEAAASTQAAHNASSPAARPATAAALGEANADKTPCGVAAGYQTALLASLGNTLAQQPAGSPSIVPNTGVPAGIALGGVMGSLSSGSPVIAQRDSNAPMHLSAGAARMLLSEKTDPIYPPVAKAAHVQGAVILHAIISKTGAVESLAVISGPPLLQQSALDAVHHWKYRPFLLNGVPTAVDTTITVNFTFAAPSATAPP